MAFKAIALDPAQFAAWTTLGDADLARRGARRQIADASPGFPCRISLEDAEVGEPLVLLPFEHHPVDTPYRAAGPVYVREEANRWPAPVDVVPPVLRTRLLSVRAYDAHGMMQNADVVEGAALEACIGALFADETTDYLHVHFARQGCYACRVERA